MFDEKELTLIISVLVTESVNLRRMIVEKRYCCKEELEALQREADDTEKLTKKVSILLNSEE